MEQRSIVVRDVELCYFEQGDRTRTTVLFVHATGFHARCWDQTIACLGDGYHVIAVDMRGHGRSSKVGPYDWGNFGADLADFVAALDLRDVIGVGHSMGGHCIVQATVAHPDRFRRLVLVDPVIVDPAAYEENARAPTYRSAEDHPVSRRRGVWASADEMYRRFEDRHPFSLWRPAVLRDYCNYGLNPLPDGTFTLGCPPIVEASIYLGSAATDILDQIDSVQQPTIVLRAFKRAERDGEMDFAQSPTYAGLAGLFPNGVDVYLPELTHFIPMQAPDLVARHITGGG